MSATELFSVTITAAICTSLAFLLLYAIFVPRRLAKAGIKVEEGRWDFLVMRGLPLAQLQAYASLLSPDERRRLHNRYLLNAPLIILGLYFIAAVLILYDGLAR
ncbi:hypothetical protein [Lysobacter brunescens]|uniref:Transmembrane protein n=1 Tax=Lysobacter brunescens TaxID=262323 RepID=A0ABW2Y971_9GAMM